MSLGLRCFARRGGLSMTSPIEECPILAAARVGNPVISVPLLPDINPKRTDPTLSAKNAERVGHPQDD